jgi:16S rRNA processing protein RimM
VVLVGQVVGVFGVEGAVKVRALTDFDDRFDAGAELFLEGESRRVEWSRLQPTGLVVKLSGLDNREVAATQRGRYLEIPEEDIRPLPEGRWYHHQLVGLAVATADGRELGRLTDVMERPANDVWVVRRDGQLGGQPGGEEHLIPATREAVLDVDLEAGRVTVANWLLEVEDA